MIAINIDLVSDVDDLFKAEKSMSLSVLVEPISKFKAALQTKFTQI